MDMLRRTPSGVLTLDRCGTGSIYGERIEVIEGRNYREWIPWRSKLGALLKKREDIHLKQGSVLYLGAAQGTTVSHISDIMEDGIIFAVEFSPVAFRKLAALSRKRDNIVPILADAFHPQTYRSMVREVDMIYQDVSQKDQVGMYVSNSVEYLKKGGSGYLMLKARSIDVTSDPARIYDRAVSELKRKGIEVDAVEDLSPYQVDHAAVITRFPG